MSPERTRWLLAGSVAVMGGIWANALLFQTKPTQVATARPAAVKPVETRVAIETSPVHIGHVSAPVSASESLSPTEPSLDLIDSLRLELLRLGYGPITRAPTVGLQFRAAILAYEYDQHLPLTAEPSDALLALASGAVSAPKLGAPDARRIVGPGAERTVNAVQTMLTSLGFKAGPADGRSSDATTTAIRAFESDQGLPVTGRISALLMTRLVAATGARGAAVQR